MKKLAIIDLDGVVADATERFKHAEEIKQSYLYPDGKDAINAYWQAVFDPAYVPTDTLIEGTNEALLNIQELGYKVVFLTSRPESMRDAIVQWLFEHTVYDADDKLVMKAPAFQYTKTPVWKAGMVQTLATLYGASIVKFIDDEEANWNELLKHTPYVNYSLEWLKSLKQAVESLEK